MLPENKCRRICSINILSTLHILCGLNLLLDFKCMRDKGGGNKRDIHKIKERRDPLLSEKSC